MDSQTPCVVPVQEAKALLAAVQATVSQIQIAVAVVVGPGHIAPAQIDQTGIGPFHKRAAAVFIKRSLGLGTAVFAHDDQVGIAVAVVVTPVHGAFHQPNQPLLGRDNLLDVELFFPGPWRARQRSVYRLHAPVISDVGRQVAAEKEAGSGARIARPPGHRARKDVAGTGLGADAQIVGEGAAFGIAAGKPVETDAAADGLGGEQLGRGDRRLVGRSQVAVEAGVGLARLILAQDQQFDPAVVVVVGPGHIVAGQSR